MFCSSANAQVAINPSGASPDPSAILDIQATDKGLLIPRVTLISSDDNINPVNNPARGLMVYNMDSALPEGFYVWNGYTWSSLASTSYVENTMFGAGESAFGEMYEFNEPGSYSSIQLTSDGAWHGWTTSTTGDTNFVSTHCIGHPCRMMVDQEGYFQVTFQASVRSSSSNVVFDAAIFKNDTVQNDLRTRVECSAAQTTINTGFTGIIYLSPGDEYIDLRFSGSQNKEIRLEIVNLSIQKLD